MGPKISRKTSTLPNVGSASEELVPEIQRVLTLDLAQLRQRWTVFFAGSPASRLGRVLMIRAIAYWDTAESKL